MAGENPRLLSFRRRRRAEDLRKLRKLSSITKDTKNRHENALRTIVFVIHNRPRLLSEKKQERGLARLPGLGFGPVLGNRLVQFVVVEPGEPFDDFAADQVLLDNFRDIVHGDARIPRSIRMDH